MTQTNSDIPAVSPYPAAMSPAPRRRRWLAWLIVLLLAGAVAASWLLWRAQNERVAQIEQALDQLRAMAAQLDTRQNDMIEVSQQASAQLASFDSRLDGYDELAGRLTEQIQGGRVRFQLAAVENLLLSANERVQLQHDARGAIAALDLADERLAALAEPRLFKLRESVARERAMLAAVPQPDLASTALTLSSLMARVPQLPLRARVPERVDTVYEPVALPAGATWGQRARAGILEALGSVFSLRRSDGPAPRLLPADQEALVYQVLALKLEGARVALLRNDATSYRDLCDSASRWIGDYFRADDANVLAARAELDRLKAVRLDAPLPDITRSLALLRGYLDSAPQ